MWVQKLLGRDMAGQVLASVGLLLTACNSQPLASVEGDTAGREARLITTADAELEPVIASNNRFAWSVYQASVAPGQNLFFSPFSINVALSMTYAGARGDTASQVEDALLVHDAATHHAQLGALTRDLTGAHGRGYQLDTASRLFGLSGMPWADDTLELLDSAYQAPLQELPFSSDPQAARSTVNDWVSQVTREHVPDLIKQDDFDTLTRFALVSAIYFEARWAQAFDASESFEGQFSLEDGSELAVTYMSRRARQRVAEDADVTLVELDYADQELSLLLLIPHQQVGLTLFETTLGTERVDALLNAAQEIEAIVQLPRLALRTELPLSEVLQGLGVRDAFDPLRADFSGMFSEPVEPIFLTATRHQAYVELDELGTKAAAATAVVAGTRSSPALYAADHPFAFVIRDKLTGAYLFAGRVVDPR